jgi:hypothetical protein
MADQPIVSPFLACRASLIIIGANKTSGHTESIGTHFPLETRLNKVVEPAPNAMAPVSKIVWWQRRRDLVGGYGRSRSL